MLPSKQAKNVFYFINRTNIQKIFSRQYCDSKDQDTDKMTKGIKERLKTKISDKTLLVGICAELEPKDEFPISERERDASVTAKLSKQAGNLTGKNIPLPSTGLNLCLEIIKDKPPIVDGIDIEILKKLEKRPIPILDPPSKKIPKGDDPQPPQPKLKRGEPGKVVIGFVPKEWVDFFVPKTGVTGFYTFFVTFGTYLVSKELYVLEHNFYGGLSMIITVWGTVKYIGPYTATYLDKEIDKIENMWNQSRIDQKNNLHKSIDDELFGQYQMAGQLTLVEAKKENVAFQLEEEFRKRQMMVYGEVKKRLDYHVSVENVYQRIRHKNLVQYVHKEVLKSITPDMHNQLIDTSIDALLADLGKTGDKTVK